MSSPKTILLYLMDGTVTGRVKASLSNWTGVTYVLPRTTLHLSNDREELRKTGVYLLFGTDEEGSQKVYVGQARERKNGEGVLRRIKEHVGEDKLDYWTHAVLIVTSNDAFGPTEISYLENRFTQMARDANRFKVVNGNDPSPGHVTEEKRAELDEFISHARTVIGSLNYRVFEPVDDAKSTSTNTDSPTFVSEEPELYMAHASYTAYGRQTNDGFVVLAGSKLRPEAEFVSSCPPSVYKARERNRAFIDDGFQLLADVLFPSPTAAAQFVGGSSLSGLATWKTKEGRSLRELERTELGD